MRDKKIFVYHAEACKALGHPLRIEIIDLLQREEQCFSDILEETGGLKSNLSQHLSVMVKNGILKVRRDGKSNFYSLTSRKVAQACRLMREVLIENLKKHKAVLETF